MLPAQPNHGLIGGLECLEAVAATGRPVGSRELSRLLEMNHTRVNRLLKTLTHIGVLVQTSERKYRPGPGIHALAALSLRGSHLLTAALPHVRELWKKGYVVTLGVLWRQYVCSLLYAHPNRPFDTAIAGHDIRIASESSAGLMLLATLPLNQITRYDIQQQTFLATSPDHLKTTLVQARRDGHAVLRLKSGLTSVGVPIGSPPEAALAAWKPDLTLDTAPELARQLKVTAAKIVAEM